jgi:hypothetical protein
LIGDADCSDRPALGEGGLGHLHHRLGHQDGIELDEARSR